MRQLPLPTAHMLFICTREGARGGKAPGHMTQGLMMLVLCSACLVLPGLAVQCRCSGVPGWWGHVAVQSWSVEDGPTKGGLTQLLACAFEFPVQLCGVCFGCNCCQGRR